MSNLLGFSVQGLGLGGLGFRVSEFNWGQGVGLKSSGCSWVRRVRTLGLALMAETATSPNCELPRVWRCQGVEPRVQDSSASGTPNP